MIVQTKSMNICRPLGLANSLTRLGSFLLWWRLTEQFRMMGIPRTVKNTSLSRVFVIVQIHCLPGQLPQETSHCCMTEVEMQSGVAIVHSSSSFKARSAIYGHRLKSIQLSGGPVWAPMAAFPIWSLIDLPVVRSTEPQITRDGH